MNSICLATSPGFSSIRKQLSFDALLRPSSSWHGGSRLSYSTLHTSSIQLDFSCSTGLSVCSALPIDEGVVSMMNFEELMEKDWSFLEPDDAIPKEDHDRKISRVIAAGQIGDESRIVVSIGSDEFVDRLADKFPDQFMLVVHDSLLMLAGIVERYDTVKCWKGELTYVPEKWAPFDVVFLYCLPALPFELDEIFGVLANRCKPGARVVISHVVGRQGLEQQRREFGDVIVADLPDKTTLEKVAADHCFTMVEFTDDPTFYLVVLEMKAIIEHS